MLINPVLLHRFQKKVKPKILYNWYAVSGSGLSSISSLDDFKAPTNIQVSELYSYLGGNSVAGGKLKEIGLANWQSPNTGASDLFGFKALPVGFRSESDGMFYGSATAANWWCLNEYSSPYAYMFNVSYISEYAYLQYASKRRGQSVRLVKSIINADADGTIYPNCYTGNNGILYSGVKIGNQIWLTEFLRETKYRNGSSIANVTDNTAWAALTTGAYCTYNNE